MYGIPVDGRAAGRVDRCGRAAWIRKRRTGGPRALSGAPSAVESFWLGGHHGEDDIDGPGAVHSIVHEDPEHGWEIVLELIRIAGEDDDAIGFVAAGPLEELVKGRAETFIDRFEAAAARDPGFLRCMRGVWSREEYHSPEVAGRLRRLGVVLRARRP